MKWLANDYTERLCFSKTFIPEGFNGQLRRLLLHLAQFDKAGLNILEFWRHLIGSPKKHSNCFFTERTFK